MARVMIVEDENIVAMDIRQRLEMLGYEVTATVTTGEEAIELADKTRPDVVLMDIVLKGEVDGIEAAEEIRRRLGIPIIYITAYSDSKTLERAKVTEPFGYIIKPFEDRELQSVIEIALYKDKMEKKLRESEERYRAIIRSLNDVLFTLDADEKYTRYRVKYKIMVWLRRRWWGKPPGKFSELLVKYTMNKTGWY